MTASINNYTVGKGIVSFRKDGAGAYADMGNCTEFEFTPELEKLDHFSSREGVRTKDKSIVIQKSGTVRLVLDEWTRDNIALAVLGTNAIVGGQSITEIFDSNAIKGRSSSPAPMKSDPSMNGSSRRSSSCPRPRSRCCRMSGGRSN